MHNRMLSFQRAVLSATLSAFNSSLGEKVAEISTDALEKAASLVDLGEKVGGVAAQLFQTLKGTSRSSGYSTESAKFHRHQHWALCDYFGLPALVFTITPYWSPG